MPAHTKITVSSSDDGSMIKIGTKGVSCAINQTSVMAIQLCVVVVWWL